MIAVDTNVLVRWVLGDDPVQSPRAERQLSEPTFIGVTVMLELGWVLAKRLRLDRALVSQLMQTVIDLETVTTEHRDAVVWALARYAKGGDWADLLHLALAARNADAFATFDEGVRKAAGRKPPVPVRAPVA